MKKILKALLPPILIRLIRRYAGITYTGHYQTWSEAKKKTEGYDSAVIFEKVKNAALKVKQGKAYCERDSVLFNKPQYAWRGLACLMFVAARYHGKLNVLDFGGSLGSAYFTNRRFLQGINMSWSIVEQSHFVTFGQKEIADERLQFYDTVDQCCLARKPNVVLLSSVLQYLEKPYETLKEIANCGAEFILLDRLTCTKKNQAFIQVQKVPSTIYQASYPVHIFKESDLLDFMSEQGFQLYEKFTSDIDCETAYFYSCGLFFSKVVKND